MKEERGKTQALLYLANINKMRAAFIIQHVIFTEVGMHELTDVVKRAHRGYTVPITRIPFVWG